MADKLNNEIIEMLINVMRTMRHSLSGKLGASHITMLQFEALWHIKQNKNTQMSDISKHFATTMPTATSLVDKLILINLVKRIDDPEDRRIVNVKLTKKGEKILRDFLRQRESRMNLFLSFLSLSDKKDLLRIMKKISKNI